MPDVAFVGDGWRGVGAVDGFLVGNVEVLGLLVGVGSCWGRGVGSRCVGDARLRGVSSSVVVGCLYSGRTTWACGRSCRSGGCGRGRYNVARSGVLISFLGYVLLASIRCYVVGSVHCGIVIQHGWWSGRSEICSWSGRWNWRWSKLLSTDRALIATLFHA